MKIFVLGNLDIDLDNKAFLAMEKLKDIDGVEFQIINVNDDLPAIDGMVLMDTVLGIEKVELISEEYLDKLVMPPRNSVHDFDLGYQLKYLIKIGKISKVTIIGLPMDGEIDYSELQSILRKLVAQDIQGS